jgi:uncharacterized protein (TIGR02145 family)
MKIHFTMFRIYNFSLLRIKNAKKRACSFYTYFLYCIVGGALIFLPSSCSTNDKTDAPESKVEETLPRGQVGEPIQDTDGQVYPTVTIGSQTWMAEDLKKTEIECNSNQQAKFVNGIERGPGVKLYVTDPRYAWYKNNKELGFGVIYNFSVLQHCDLCPPGYRIPTKADWEKLIDEVGGKSVAAKALMLNGNSGFNAKLGGRIDDYGSVLGGVLGFWWSSDMTNTNEAYIFEIGRVGNIKLIPQPIRVGNYVRCIKE